MWRTAAAGATCGLLLTVFGAAASDAARVRTCRGLPSDGTITVTNLRAAGTTCTSARHVARAYRADTEICPIAEECEIFTYTCRLTRRDTNANLLLGTVRCVRAGRRITFTEK